MSPAHSLVHSGPSESEGGGGRKGGSQSPRSASKAALRKHPLPRVTAIPAEQTRTPWDGGVGGRGRAGPGKLVCSAGFTAQSWEASRAPGSVPSWGLRVMPHSGTLFLRGKRTGSLSENGPVSSWQYYQGFEQGLTSPILPRLTSPTCVRPCACGAGWGRNQRLA